MISVISGSGRYAVIGVGVLVPFVFRLIVTPRFAALVIVRMIPLPEIFGRISQPVTCRSSFRYEKGLLHIQMPPIAYIESGP